MTEINHFFHHTSRFDTDDNMSENFILFVGIVSSKSSKETISLRDSTCLKQVLHCFRGLLSIFDCC